MVNGVKQAYYTSDLYYLNMKLSTDSQIIWKKRLRIYFVGQRSEIYCTTSHPLKSTSSTPKPRRQMADTRRQQKPIKLLKTGIMSSGKTSNVLKLLTAIFFVHIVKTHFQTPLNHLQLEKRVYFYVFCEYICCFIYRKLSIVKGLIKVFSKALFPYSRCSSL